MRLITGQRRERKEKKGKKGGGDRDKKKERITHTAEIFLNHKEEKGKGRGKRHSTGPLSLLARRGEGGTFYQALFFF